MPWPTHIVAAGGYVFDQHGNILLVKTHNRGWDCTGGQVENGESAEEGVIREIMEESGITATVRGLAGIYQNVRQTVWHDGVTPVPTKLMLDFICDYVCGEPQPSEENSETIWVPRERALDYVTAPAMRFRFQNLLDYSGKVVLCSYVTQPEFKVLSMRYV
jgi:8-oxo-dGTP diphosphatase